jgi:hypothetical protein
MDMHISQEQFVREIEPLRIGNRLVRVHRFEGQESCFFFGTIKEVTEYSLTCRSRGNGGQKEIDLQSLSISTNLSDYFPYHAWRLSDREGNHWDVIDVEISEEQKQAKLMARSAKIEFLKRFN